MATERNMTELIAAVSKQLDAAMSDSVGEIFTNLHDEKKQRQDELAEKFGKSLAEKLEKDAKTSSTDPRHNTALEELMSAPVVKQERKPEGDLRHNTALDDLFGFDPPKKEKHTETNANRHTILEDFPVGIPITEDEYSAPKSKTDYFQKLADQITDFKPFQGTFDFQDSAKPNRFPTKAIGEEGWLNEPLPLGLNQGTSDCCEKQLQLFATLNTVIGDLADAVKDLAGSMVPKEPKTDEELAEELRRKQEAVTERKLTKSGSPFELFGFGLDQGKRWGREDATESPKGMGQTIGRSVGTWQKNAEFMGAGEGLSQLAGVAGGVVAGFGLLTGAIDGLKNKIMDFGEGLLRANFQFSQFSGAMQAAEAKMKVREMMYARDRGNARADTADKFAEAWSEMKSAWAPVADLLANFLNTVGTVLAKILTFVSKIFSFLDRPATGTSDVATDELRGIVSRSISETYGLDVRWGS